MLMPIKKTERSEIINMELKNTIELMNGTDFKDRFKAEYYQLQNRRDGLNKMLSSLANGTLPFTPKCSYNLLHEQLVYMDGYLAVLEQRAVIESIDLKE